MPNNRKHPEHGVILFQDRPTIVFLTVCTKQRKHWLANEAVHSQLREVWKNSQAWLVGR